MSEVKAAEFKRHDPDAEKAMVEARHKTDQKGSNAKALKDLKFDDDGKPMQGPAIRVLVGEKRKMGVVVGVEGEGADRRYLVQRTDSTEQVNAMIGTFKASDLFIL